MPDILPRRTICSVEEIFHEGGPAPRQPLRRAAMLAVIENPFAGRYAPDIRWFMEPLKPLGVRMAERLVALLGGADRIEGYGKGAIVGEAGELEHGALWHMPGGHAMRELLNGSRAIVPSTKKVGGPGARLDVPIAHVGASYVRSHFDAIAIRLNDAPRADEIMVAVAVTDGARPLSRSGGLTAADVRGEDGLR